MIFICYFFTVTITKFAGFLWLYFHLTKLYCLCKFVPFGIRSEREKRFLLVDALRRWRCVVLADTSHLNSTKKSVSAFCCCEVNIQNKSSLDWEKWNTNSDGIIIINFIFSSGVTVSFIFLKFHEREHHGTSST